MANFPEEGQKAPIFSLSDQDGKKVNLGDFLGKEVLVYFYPKDDTPGCTKEACSIRDNWQGFAAKGVQVLGISRDDGPSHQKFREKYNLPFPLLSDPDATVMKAYGAWGEKNMYGKISEGVIRSSFLIGPDGTIKKVWKKVKTESHGADVLGVL